VSFEGFVCWKTKDLNDIAVIDAAAFDDAIFTATHQPLKVMTQFDSSGGVGALISEEKLREEFSIPLGNDPHIIAITGATGTGKSHLVKWLYANSTGQHSWHQVYIRKRNTSLRRVIGDILEGMSGPMIDDLRDKLAEATLVLTDLDEAKARVLNELAHRMQYPAKGLDGLDISERETRVYLHDILHDPVIRRYLLRNDGAIHRLTRLGMEGLRADDDESGFFISEGDLPRTPADLSDASAPARKGIALLNQAQAFRTSAVNILNEELAYAKTAVFIGKGVDLRGVFDEVRVELAKRQLELTLYIEDLVLLHGIDRELAQVFTEPRTDDSRCGLRVVIAVTAGYLDKQGLDTLQDRARHYSLDLELGTGVSESESLTFVARYLNATRVGKSRLRQARAEATQSDWIPNACLSCDFRDECHSAFGVSELGYGYYPFNQIAISRMVVQIGWRSDEAGHFDPRSVVRGVIRDPLSLASVELEDNRFPSGEFAADLDVTRSRISPEVRHKVSGMPQGDQKLSLLAFWAPEIGTISPEICKAFGVDFANLQDFSISSTSPTEPTPPEPPTKPKVDVEFQNLDNWVNQKENLTAALSRTLRQTVVDAIATMIRQGSYGVRITGQGKNLKISGIPFVEESIQIEASQGGGAEVKRRISIEIDRSDASLVLLKNMLTAKRESSWAGVGAKGYASFQKQVDAWVDMVLRSVAAPAQRFDSVINLLIVTSQPAIGKMKTAGHCLEAILSTRLDPDGRTRAWAEFVKGAQRARSLALSELESQLASSKGEGAPGILDVAPILSSLWELKGTKSLDSDLDGDGVVTNWQQLITLHDRASKEEWKEVAKLSARCNRFLDVGNEWGDLWKKVAEAVDKAAVMMGFLPTQDARVDLEAKRQRVPEDMALQLRNLGSVENPESGDLWRLVPDPSTGLEALAEYLETADRIIASLEQKTKEAGQSRKGTIGTGEVVRDLLHFADELEKIVRGEA